MAKIDDDLKNLDKKTDSKFKDLQVVPRNVLPMIASVHSAKNGKNSYLVGEHKKRVV
jgi:hypothetical protein